MSKNIPIACYYLLYCLQFKQNLKSIQTFSFPFLIQLFEVVACWLKLWRSRLTRQFCLKIDLAVICWASILLLRFWKSTLWTANISQLLRQVWLSLLHLRIQAVKSWLLFFNRFIELTFSINCSCTMWNYKKSMKFITQASHTVSGVAILWSHFLTPQFISCAWLSQFRKRPN